MTVANPEQVDIQASERFNYFLDVLNNGSTSGDKIRHIKTNSRDQDRYNRMLYLHYQSPILHHFVSLVFIFIISSVFELVAAIKDLIFLKVHSHLRLGMEFQHKYSDRQTE